jgi:transcriptional regulator with GAF, ATPase, and Fis domain
MSTEHTREPFSSDADPEDGPASDYVRALVEENQKLRALLAAQQTGNEDHMARLASLYVAVNSVHSALDQRGVLSTVRDIVTTLVGSEEMAIFEVDAPHLTLLSFEGIDPSAYQNLRIGEGAIGAVAKTGEALIRLEGGSIDSTGDEALSACIPLKLGERVIGVLAVFRLLPQKGRFDTSDLELFDALTAHVATALMFTRLYAVSEGSPGASM